MKTILTHIVKVADTDLVEVTNALLMLAIASPVIFPPSVPTPPSQAANKMLDMTSGEVWPWYVWFGVQGLLTLVALGLSIKSPQRRLWLNVRQGCGVWAVMTWGGLASLSLVITEGRWGPGILTMTALTALSFLVALRAGRQFD